MAKRKGTKNAPSPAPEPSDPSDPETQFIELTDDEVNLWDAVEIVAEKGNMFKIRWAGTDPKTKKPWEDSWVVKTDCTNDLVEAWRVDHPKSASTAKKTKTSRSRKSTAAKAKSKSPVKYISRPITIPKREERDEYDEVPTTKAGPSTSKGKSQLLVSSKKRKRTASSYDEDDDDDELAPQQQDESVSRSRPSKTKKRKILTTTVVVDKDRDAESEDDIPKPPPKKPRGRPPVSKPGGKQTGRKTAAVQREPSPSPSVPVDEPDFVDAAPAPYDIEKTTTTPNGKPKSTPASDVFHVGLGSGKRNSFTSGTLRIDSPKKALDQGQGSTGDNGVTKKSPSSTTPTAAKSKPLVPGLRREKVADKRTPNSNSKNKTHLVNNSRSRQKLKEEEETETESEEDEEEQDFDDDIIDEMVQEVVNEREEGELDDPEEESEVEDGQVVTVTTKPTGAPVVVGTNKSGSGRALAQREDSFVLMPYSPLAKGWSKDKSLSLGAANEVGNEETAQAAVQTVRKTVSRPRPARASEPQPQPQPSPSPSPASKFTSRTRKEHSESELNYLTNLERSFSPSTQLKLKEFDDLMFPDPVSFGVPVSPPSPYRVLGFLPGVATTAAVGGTALPAGAANAGDTAPATGDLLAPPSALPAHASAAVPATTLTDSQNSGDTDISIVPETEDPGSSQPRSQEQLEQSQPELSFPSSPQKQNQNQNTTKTTTSLTSKKTPARRPPSPPATSPVLYPIVLTLHDPLKSPSRNLFPAFEPTKPIKSLMRSRSRSPGKPTTDNSTRTSTKTDWGWTGRSGSGMRTGTGNGGALDINEDVDGEHKDAEVEEYDYEEYIDLSPLVDSTTATAKAKGVDERGRKNGAGKEKKKINGSNGSEGKDKDKNAERGKGKEKEKKLGPIPVVPPETFYPHLSDSVGHDGEAEEEEEEEEERIDQWSSPLKRGQPPATTAMQAQAQVTQVHARACINGVSRSRSGSRSRSVEADAGGVAHSTGEEGEEGEEMDVDRGVEGDVGKGMDMNVDENSAPAPSAPITSSTHPQAQPNHTQEQSHSQSQYSLPSPSPSLSPPKLPLFSLSGLNNILSVYGATSQSPPRPQPQSSPRPQPQLQSQSHLPNQSQSLLNADANANNNANTNTTSSQSPLNATSGSGTLYPNISQMIDSSQDSEVLRQRIIARGMEIVEEVKRKKGVELGYGYPRGGVRRKLDEIIGPKDVELEVQERRQGKEKGKEAAITSVDEYHDDAGGEASQDLSMELQYPEEQDSEHVVEQVPDAEVETVAVARFIPKTNARREGIVSPSHARELSTLYNNGNNTNDTRLTKQPDLQVLPAQVEAAKQEKQSQSLLLEIASLKEALSVANASNGSYASRLEDSIAQSQSLHTRVEELLKENVNLRAQAKKQEPITITTASTTTPTSTDDSHPTLAQLEALKAQNTQLSTDLANAQSAKTYLEKDRDFLRAQYATLDTYASQTRLENIDLLKRTEIAEKQVSEGIALIKASFEEKLRVSEEQCKSFSRITEFMIKKDAATDGVRRDAAEAPELRARCLELEAELKGVREEVERLEAEMEVEQLRVEALEREKERVEEEWKRVVGKAKEDLTEARKEVGKLMVNLNEVKARQHQSGDSSKVFRCEWRPAGDEGPCLYVCETAEELEDHAVHGGHIDIS